MRKRTWGIETILSKNAVKEHTEIGTYLEGNGKSRDCFLDQLIPAASLCTDGRGSTERQISGTLEKEVIAGELSSKGHCVLYFY